MNIDELKRENLRLKAENKYYKKKIENLTGKKSVPKREFLKRTLAERHKSYSGYLKSTAGMSAAADIAFGVFYALRRFFLASTVVKVIRLFIMLLQSGATAAAAVIIAAVALPAAVLMSLAGAAVALVSRKSCERRLSGLTGTVYIVFGDAVGCYAEELSEKGTLLCVTSSIFRSGFLSASKPRGGKTYIHISFVFSLVRTLKKNESIKIIEIF